MYRSTAISLIFTELTGVIAVLIDGIVTSRCLGADAYSGISLLGPFTSIVLLVAGIFSAGCSIVCSQFVGQGKKEEANEAFNLSSLLTVLLSFVIILACMAVPSLVLQLCGVPLSKYPELNPHMYGYLDGYKMGLPAFMLVQVIAPILVMDNGKKLFTTSSIVLCVVDIACDLLNAFAFHGGTFGMGLATSISYWVQAIMLVAHFVRPDHYFRYSLGHLSLRHFGAVFANGTPALVKKLALTADVSEHTAKLMTLFVEEMAINVVKFANQRKESVRVDFRLFMDGSRICLSLMDLGDCFDPTVFYELHAGDNPTKNIGIRMVMNMAEEVRYFSAFGSNNLVVYVN